MEHEMKQYNHTLNYFKALACFCVVMLHCGFPGIVGKLIYGPSRFAVPFFFMVSGYYVYNENFETVKSKLPKKIVHILKLFLFSEVVYFIWHTIQYYISDGFGGVIAWYKSIVTLESLAKLLLFQTTSIGDVSWFLVALILCYVATYFISKFKLWSVSRKLSIVLLVINVVIGELLPFFGVVTNWYWNSNFWLLGLPCFVIGSMLKKNIDKYTAAVSAKGIITALVLLIVLCEIERVLTSASQFFISSAPIAVCAILLSQKYPNGIKNKCMTLVENIGIHCSFYVYIFHPIIRDMYALLLPDSVILSWIKPIVVFTISAMLGWMFSKLNFNRKPVRS